MEVGVESGMLDARGRIAELVESGGRYVEVGLEGRMLDGRCRSAELVEAGGV